ncbi:hypothetical protein Emag_001899 [Eimeria magna]
MSREGNHHSNAPKRLLVQLLQQLLLHLLQQLLLQLLQQLLLQLLQELLIMIHDDKVNVVLLPLLLLLQQDFIFAAIAAAAAACIDPPEEGLRQSLDELYVHPATRIIDFNACNARVVEAVFSSPFFLSPPALAAAAAGLSSCRDISSSSPRWLLLRDSSGQLRGLSVSAAASAAADMQQPQLLLQQQQQLWFLQGLSLTRS